MTTFRNTEGSFDVISGLEVCRDWIELVTGETFSSDDFQNSTSNGILLCKLINEISPGLIKQVNNNPRSTFGGRDNVEMFLNGCKQLGLQEQQLFQVDDLVTGKKLRNVAVTIHWLAYVANQLNLSLPPFDPLHISRISLPNEQKINFDLSSAKTQTAMKPKNPEKDASGNLPPMSTEIAKSMDELDKMLLELEVDPPAPVSSSLPGSNQARSAAAPAPTPVIAPFGGSGAPQSSLPAHSNSPNTTNININIHTPPAAVSQAPVSNSASPSTLPRGVSESGPSSSVPQPSSIGGGGFNNSPSQTSLPNRLAPGSGSFSGSPSVAPSGMQAASPRGSNQPHSNQNKPAPVWKDAPVGGNANNPSTGGYSSPGTPNWSDKTDPNQAKCFECSSPVQLGKTAFSWGNNTFCINCLCGTCGNAFQGRKKVPGPESRFYCPDCICKKCSRAIEGQFVPEGNSKICINCVCSFCRGPLGDNDTPPLCSKCRCNRCLVALQGRYYPGPGGHRYCTVCIDIINKPYQTPSQQPAAPIARSVNPSASPCKKCKSPLSGSIIECDGFKFHLSCFACVDCGKNGVQLLSNEPYCNDCHPDKVLCSVCNLSLRGGGLEALGRFYHDKCFTCQRCHNPLPGGVFKEVDGFALCSHCAIYIRQNNVTHN